MRRVVSSDELTQAGVSIEKKGGKWVHTIPATVRLNGDPEPIEVVVQGAEVENGVYSVSRDTVADMSFSDVNGKYRVTFSERKLQPKSVD